MSASATLETAKRPRARPARRLAYLGDVMVHLVRVELATRNRGSLLGWLWSLGPPLFQLAVTYFLFTRIIPLNVPNYPVFLLTGILSWTWFSRSLNEATPSLEIRRDLVFHPGFATELVPLTVVLVALVDYLLALPVLFVALAFTTGLDATAALLPLLLLLQLVLTVGLVLLVAPLQVFVRDTRQLVSLLVSVGFWLTPVFYRRTQVPAGLGFLYDINPMAHLIESQRQILLYGTVPRVMPLVYVALGSLATLALGWAVFERCKHSIPDEL